GAFPAKALEACQATEAGCSAWRISSGTVWRTRPVCVHTAPDGKMRPIDDRRFKGLPLPAGVPGRRIGDLGGNALQARDYPVLVLHEEQRRHNIATMAEYSRQYRVQLAPHAKTSLSPQL